MGLRAEHLAGRHDGPRPPWAYGQMPPHGSPFARLDSDADGKITKEEVLKAFASVDKNGDGAVTREEFMKAVMSFAPQTKPKDDEGAAGSASHTPAGAPGNGTSSGGRHQDGERSPGGGPRGFGRGPGGFGPGIWPGGGLGSGRFGGPNPGSRAGRGGPSASAIFERFDKDHKGSLTKADVPERQWDRISKADGNGDGSISKDELEAYFGHVHPHGGPQATESKPAEKPNTEKPQEPKVDDSKPQASNSDAEQPVDATAVANVTALD